MRYYLSIHCYFKVGVISQLAKEKSKEIIVCTYEPDPDPI